jgi:hypothetical protein
MNKLGNIAFYENLPGAHGSLRQKARIAVRGSSGDNSLACPGIHVLIP